jgi:hypothetical protein
MQTYDNFTNHIKKFSESIYNEYRSLQHEGAARGAMTELLEGIDFNSAVEFGCGTAPCLDCVKEQGKQTLGITIGDEPCSHEVLREDMHFTSLPDQSYDLAIARHVLEHSPIPLILLSEMRRIAKQYAIVIVPTPTERMINYQNHYSVFSNIVWEKFFSLTGWSVLKFRAENYFFDGHPAVSVWDSEYRYLLKAK